MEAAPVVGIIFLPLRSLSIQYRPYLDEVEGQPLLKWFAQWWKTHHSGIGLAIAGGDASVVALGMETCVADNSGSG